jgi:hypothetical protein
MVVLLGLRMVRVRGMQGWSLASNVGAAPRFARFVALQPILGLRPRREQFFFQKTIAEFL